jgi:hypothetical protein
VSACTACDRRLYFHERAGGPTLCRPCAAAAGVIRLCDRAWLGHMRSRAALVEPWWSWTVWLEHALRWTEHDAAGRRDACTEPM